MQTLQPHAYRIHHGLYGRGYTDQEIAVSDKVEGRQGSIGSYSHFHADRAT